MAKAIESFNEAKGDLTAAMVKFTNVIDAAQREVADLESQKAVLAAEVASISRSLQPLRTEADGQRREASKAYEAARIANVEGEKQMAELNEKLQKLRQQADDAQQRAEAAYVEHMKTRQQEINEIDKKLEQKKKELADFHKKWAKVDL